MSWLSADKLSQVGQHHLGLGAWVSGNVFLVKRVFEQV